MKRYLLLFFLLLPVSMFAQGVTDKLIYVSLDPESDSIQAVKMQARMAEIRKTRPTVAVVLSGGGAKGASHVGALKYFEEIGLPIDMILGTSMGGLMGGLYSLGYDAATLDSILQNMDWGVMMSDRIPSKYYPFDTREFREHYNLTIPFHYDKATWELRNRIDQFADDTEGNATMYTINDNMQKLSASLPEGFIYGLNLYNYLASMSLGYQDDMDFADLPIPFFCVSADMATLKEYNWTHGNIVNALRSTMSIPLYYMPVRVDGKIMVDGGTLNNLPIDLARTMGADIVIAVDIAKTYNYERVKNVADISMLLMQGMAAHTYEINKADADVYMTPDVLNFGMLDFGTEQIAQIISKGYDCAKEFAPQLDSIIALTGRQERKLAHPAARNASDEKISIGKISYKGLTDKEIEFFEDKQTLQVGGSYGKDELDEAVAGIFSTSAFKKVTYSLYGNDEPYNLEFNCEKGPVHMFSSGFRADSEQILAAIFNLGLGGTKIWGSKFFTSIRLGSSPDLNFDYLYTPVKGPSIEANLDIRYSQIPKSQMFELDESFVERFQYNTAALLLRSNKWKRISASAGVQYYNLLFGRAFATSIENFGSWNCWGLNALARFTVNTMDDGYFPTRGTILNLQYEYQLAGRDIDFETDEDVFPHIIQFKYETVLPLGRHLALIPDLEGRFIIGTAPLVSYENYCGGAMSGRYFPQQIKAPCVNGVIYCDDKLAVANVELRAKIGQKNYMSLIGSAFGDGMELDFSDATYSVGATLQYGYQSPIGPIKANVHWSSFDKTVGAYVSIGFDF